MIRVVLLFLSLTLFAIPTYAKEWNGLVPLHSTRKDVERVLGTPSGVGKYTSLYQLEDEVVSFIYSSGGPCGLDATSVWKVPVGTIVDITVAPRKELRFGGKDIESAAYIKNRDPSTPSLFYYTNEQEGIRYTVQETAEVPTGIVMNIDYWPAAKDNYLRCVTPERKLSNVNYAPFEDYGNISFSAEKVRLDNFAIQLQHDPSMMGYILFYAGRDASPSRARRRAARAKKYLVKARGVENTRIVTIDGGYREALTTELYLWRRDLPSPWQRKVKLPRNCTSEFRRMLVSYTGDDGISRF